MAWSDVLSGLAIVALAFVSLSWRFPLARWATAGVGLWVLFAPLLFWAPTAAAYLNDTLVGALVIGLAVGVRPAPGIDRVARATGPTIPPGWDYSPSGWFQRMPIIILAFVGLYVSRYLAAYQLGHIDGVWEPFFEGGPAPENGTEEIITSSVSEAWPVSDAGVGAVTYMLEILTGLIGSARRWRTMPWLVVLFGIMIVPLGAVSITFIVIQPIVIGTWCTLVPDRGGGHAAADPVLARRAGRDRPVPVAAAGAALSHMALGTALLITPFAYGAGWPATVASFVCGAALIGLSVRRGRIRNRYGTWDRLIV